MWSNGIAKCRQARMKIARHGAAAECRVGKRDDLSPALAGRLNHSLQKSPSSERSERSAALQCGPPNTYLVAGIPLPLRRIGIKKEHGRCHAAQIDAGRKERENQPRRGCFPPAPFAF